MRGRPPGWVRRRPVSGSSRAAAMSRTGKISRIEVSTLFGGALGVLTALTQILGMLRAPSGPDTGCMTRRYAISVADDRAGSDARGRANSLAPPIRACGPRWKAFMEETEGRSADDFQLGSSSRLDVQPARAGMRSGNCIRPLIEHIFRLHSFRCRWAAPSAETCARAAYRVPRAGERQGLNRDELYVNLGCLRKCVQVAGI